MGNASAIWVQEEENQSLEVDNDGTISATGKLTSGILTRGAFLSVENDGVISASGVGSVAIAAHNGTDNANDPDPVVPAANCTPTTPCTHSYFIGNTVIENTGSILGDTVSQGAAAIQIVDANGLRWAGVARQRGRRSATTRIHDHRARPDAATAPSSTVARSPAISTSAPATTCSRTVRKDRSAAASTSISAASLTYNRRGLSPGYQLQVFRAGEGGGDDDDDGPAPRVFTSLADFLAAIPDHHFEFDNAAPLIGNVTVHTYNGVTGADGSNAQSTILLEPHVTGTGHWVGLQCAVAQQRLHQRHAGDRQRPAPTVKRITNSTIATTTTLTPIIDSVVHSGEWFLVAQTLFGADVPVIDEDFVLVDWVAAKNGNNSLVIGSTVKNANTINGLSQPGINAINSLLSTDGTNAGVNALAAGVESLSNEGDVRKAGEQLAPETNFATQQAAITLAFLTGQYIDERLFGVGATGPSAAGFGPPSGLGASNIAPPPYALGMRIAR